MRYIVTMLLAWVVLVIPVASIAWMVEDMPTIVAVLLSFLPTVGAVSIATHLEIKHIEGGS